MKYLVTGLPRSGTTWMMKCLEAGGMPMNYQTNRYELDTVSHKLITKRNLDGVCTKILLGNLLYFDDLSESRIILMIRNPDALKDSQIRFLKAAHVWLVNGDYSLQIEKAGDTLTERGAEVFRAHLEFASKEPLSFFSTIHEWGWPIDSQKAAAVENPDR
jgi:hypothetical protein